MNKITENEIETLKGVIAQARPNEWTDFPGNGRSQRTHIGYLTETTIGEVQIPLFETNTNAKRADVLLAIYARNYLPRLLGELEKRNWISVMERLPDERGLYMAAGTFKNDIQWVNELYFSDEQEWWSGENVRYSVTHWMPLPEHPDIKSV